MSLQHPKNVFDYVPGGRMAQVEEFFLVLRADIVSARVNAKKIEKHTVLKIAPTQ